MTYLSDRRGTYVPHEGPRVRAGIGIPRSQMKSGLTSWANPCPAGPDLANHQRDNACCLAGRGGGFRDRLIGEPVRQRPDVGSPTAELLDHADENQVLDGIDPEPGARGPAP